MIAKEACRRSRSGSLRVAAKVSTAGNAAGTSRPSALADRMLPCLPPSASACCSSDVSLFGGLAIPRKGLAKVLRDALAFAVHEAEERLGVSIALLCQRL